MRVMGIIFANDVAIDALTENTIKGNLHVSVKGGNTANSEFEFLFGHSMAFLPEGCVPYQQYVQENVTALPWVMRELGYTSIATHPYYADGWSRNRIYDELGFEESTFIEDYPQQDFLRKYVTDQEMFEFVLNKLKSNDTGKPLFLFGITMQNHGGYITWIPYDPNHIHEYTATVTGPTCT